MCVENYDFRRRLMALPYDLYPLVREKVLELSGKSAQTWSRLLDDQLSSVSLLDALCSTLLCASSELLNPQYEFDAKAIRAHLNDNVSPQLPESDGQVPVFTLKSK